MQSHHTVVELNYPHNIPMIDGEFDVFEVNTDLEVNLREAETATFYHNALNWDE